MLLPLNAQVEAALSGIYDYREYLDDFIFQEWEYPLELISYTHTTLDEIERRIIAGKDDPVQIIADFADQLAGYIKTKPCEPLQVALETVENVLSIFM